MSPHQPPHKILVVGPLPPPLSGTSVSFKTFCEEAKDRPETLSLDIINSSPPHLGQTRLFTIAHLRTASGILWHFCRRIRQSEKVLIFTNHQLMLALGPLCLLIAKVAGKPCFIRPFGGSLDLYYEQLPPILRWFFRHFIRHIDGVIVQTEFLYNHFASWLGDRVHIVPGYRHLSVDEAKRVPARSSPNSQLRLVYVGHIREEKGVLVMLESLRDLTTREQESIHCDVFGPVYDEISTRFQHDISQTPCATYQGVLDPDDVIPRLRQYDALVFPSYYQGEGHPGVLIEAMMAGLPVITTAFRSIPEVVQDRVNGLLVPPQARQELTNAIRLLHEDRQLLADMAHKNWQQRTKYAADQVALRILQSMGVTI